MKKFSYVLMSTALLMSSIALAASGSGGGGNGGGGGGTVQHCVEQGGTTAFSRLTLSPWVGVAPNGATWTFTFQSNGAVFYNIGGGTLKGKWIQPLSIFQDVTPVLVPDGVNPAIVNLTDCTMIWNTNLGAIFMTRT